MTFDPSSSNQKIIDGVVVLSEFNVANLENPPADKIFLYAEDDGLGTTVIKVKDSTGTGKIISDIFQRQSNTGWKGLNFAGAPVGDYSIDIQSIKSNIVNSVTGIKSIAIGIENITTGSYSASIGWQNQSGPMNSFAFGGQNEASNVYASAFGHKNKALGTYSASFGYNNYIPTGGQWTSAFGINNIVEDDGYYASAFGYRNIVNKYASTAFGYRNSATKQRSVAVGYDNGAYGDNAVSIGRFNRSWFDNGVSVGAQTTSYASGAVAMGFATYAAGNFSTAIGYQARTNTDNTVEIGKWVGFSRNSAIRMHPAGMIGMTVEDKATEYSDGGTSQGSEASGTLPRGMFTIRRNGLQFVLDYNDNGTVKNIILGTAT